MATLNLIVKGNKHEAAKAASDRHVPFAFTQELRAVGYTLGRANASYVDLIAQWFNEPIPERPEPYPVGALLHYSYAKED